MLMIYYIGGKYVYGSGRWKMTLLFVKANLLNLSISSLGIGPNKLELVVEFECERNQMLM